MCSVHIPPEQQQVYVSKDKRVFIRIIPYVGNVTGGVCCKESIYSREAFTALKSPAHLANTIDTRGRLFCAVYFLFPYGNFEDAYRSSIAENHEPVENASESDYMVATAWR